MNTNEDRFTSEQIMEAERRTRNAAHNHEYSGTVQQAKRYRETASILRQAASDTARIAELTAEVARLTGLADGMYRRGEALLLAVDTFIATYGSEDVSLEDLHELTDADAAMCEAMEPYEAEYIARNALKDGL